MSTRMLIDARHREETRVAVVKGNRIEEFDFESEEHKQLKGNIYLAKVTRVEPSLQAAFIDYGGNRHGFLAFSEIHPDYYQIPKEDREALLREEAEHAAAEEALRGHDDEDEDDEAGPDGVETVDDGGAPETLGADDEREEDGGEDDRPAPASSGGDDHSVESLRQQRMNLRRRYKIQDVIRRRQVLLVQVVKEERGNKGAALTTYLSLAGRYCVLMPNTSHGGGISRKISSPGDRKRLKSILAELNLPQTMGCIVRTAGLQRTRAEIRRDFDYLARLWDEIRAKTLASSAPAEVYRDSDLVKRAIRDIYNKDIDEVIVEGEEGYRAARSFMKLLMPTHASKIAPYSDAIPLFQRFGVEDQLAAMYQPVVQLKSGGYIVINPTEALVSIDINSGRSTREHNIEQTATATNLEAAQEIARQLRLRDMAGLIVIDFIDMENNSNNRKVEKAIKDALKNDRARIQVGRISGFGLFEMSRQRLRTGVLEASTRLCHHCEGSGFIRTASSSGLWALRLLEEEAARGRGSRICLRASQEAALYVLNRKRAELADIEDRYGVVIEILSDGNPEGARMAVEASGPPPSHAPRLPQQIEREPDEEIVDEIEDEEEPGDEPAETRDAEASGADEGEGRGRRRRRRRRRGGRREEGVASEDGDESVDETPGDEPPGDEPLDEDAEAGEASPAIELATDDAQPPRGRSRRGRRGGRRAQPAEAVPLDEPFAAGSAGDETPAEQEVSLPLTAPEVDAEGAPASNADVAPVLGTEPGVEAPAAEEPAKPSPRRRPRARRPAMETGADVAPAGEPGAEQASAGEAAADTPTVDEAPKPRRRASRARPVGEDGEAPVPSRRRRASATAAAEDASAPQSSEPEPELALPDAEQPASAEAAETSASAQDSVAGAADVSAAAGDNAAAEPARRGWWQRTFGS